MSKTFEQYSAERLAAQGDTRPFRDRLALSGLGLGGEAGECADLIKKHLYHGKPLDREALLLELGDVLWYVMFCADVLDSSLEDVAARNSAKLRARYPDGFSVEAASKIGKKP